MEGLDPGTQLAPKGAGMLAEGPLLADPSISSVLAPTLSDSGAAPQQESGRLAAKVEIASELSESVKASMFALYERYYEATNAQLFMSDLKTKDYVILLTDHEGHAKGFSTLAVFSFDFHGARRRAIFSGDTIVDHRHWGEYALSFTWIRLAGRLKAQEPTVPLYWFLIVKGHRTYRYLPAFSTSYYPTWKRPTPPEAQGLMDHLASARFGRAYDPRTGIVAFPASRGQLKPEWAVVPPDDLRKPDVRFFLERNPSYASGHELACLTELSPETLRPLPRRLFLQGLRCVTAGGGS
jgi:hypothetical protein